MSHVGTSPDLPDDTELMTAAKTLIQCARYTNSQGDWHSDTEITLWMARDLLAAAGVYSDWENLSLDMIDDRVDWNNDAVIRLTERADNTTKRKVTLARDLLSSLDDSETKYTLTYTPDNGAEMKIEPADPEHPVPEQADQDDAQTD